MNPALRFADAPNVVSFLEGLGAARVRHSDRTFLDHLVGTAAILERWGASDPLCRAGLLHSVYGTEYFRGGVLSFDDRERVRALAGERAERLAYVFCAFERATIYGALERGAPYVVDQRGTGAKIPISEEELANLVWLVWANALEQAPRGRPSDTARERSLKALAASAPLLPEVALRELREVYASAAHREATKMDQPGLRALLNLEDTGRFLSENWPEKPYVAEGPVERLAGLVDHDFDALVRMRKHHTQAFFRTLDGRSTSIVVEPGQERALYDAGFTIYFHNLTSPKLTQWVSALDEELGLVRGVTRVAAFASRRGIGLNAHYDQNDNFVCQARGSKRWKMAANTHVHHPTVGYTLGAKVKALHEVEAPNGFPTELPEDHQVVDLRPGMVMFMPRGMWHDTETIEEESLHFNIQSGLAMWKDAIEFLLTQTSALYAEELRAPIAHLFDGEVSRDGFADELKSKLRAAVEQICESEISIPRAAFHKYVTSRRPRT
jgi:ribosomal protein L16 Arg81 hydroxylase